jgi:SRSO17 transposase
VLEGGDGAKGPRWEDQRWLTVGRSYSEPADLTVYVIFALQGPSLEGVVRVAGTRWTLRRCFGTPKSELGLDQYEIRSLTGRHRHITPAMWALSLLTVHAGGTMVETLKEGLSPS